MTNPEQNDRNHDAAVAAAHTLDAMDEQALELHDAAATAMCEFGRYIGLKGVPPAIVLGQMMQVGATAFADGIMPFYRPVLGGDDQ